MSGNNPAAKLLYSPSKIPQATPVFIRAKNRTFFEHGLVGNEFMRPDKYKLVGIRILAWGAFSLRLVSFARLKEMGLDLQGCRPKQSRMP
jgi:hypothetical protein